jgi:hypothetical protein
LEFQLAFELEFQLAFESEFLLAFELEFQLAFESEFQLAFELVKVMVVSNNLRFLYNKSLYIKFE